MAVNTRALRRPQGQLLGSETWGANMNKLLPLTALMLALALPSQAHVRDCDVVGRQQTWPALYADGFVTTEPAHDQEGEPLQLLLVRQAWSCQPRVVDRYSWEGAPPRVETAFTQARRGVPYLFVVVRWDINHRGAGTYGRFYRVHAYREDGHGSLVRDEALMRRDGMTGLDGMSDGSPSHFDATPDAIREGL